MNKFQFLLKKFSLHIIKKKKKTLYLYYEN